MLSYPMIPRAVEGRYRTGFWISQVILMGFIAIIPPVRPTASNINICPVSIICHAPPFSRRFAISSAAARIASRWVFSALVSTFFMSEKYSSINIGCPPFSLYIFQKVFTRIHAADNLVHHKKCRADNGFKHRFPVTALRQFLF